MDIRSKAVSETSTLHLRDASDELMFDGDKPVTVTVYGPGSKAYARAKTEQSNRLIDRMKKKGKTDLSPEDALREKVDFLTAITAGMDGVDYDGKQGHDLYRAVYGDVTLGFVADQVAKHVEDWGNFSKGSQTS
jgi:hypothetical protein